MSNMQFFIQDVMLKGMSPRELHITDATIFHESDCASLVVDQGKQPMVFCSLQLAKSMNRRNTSLVSGILYDHPLFDHSFYSSRINPDIMVNPYPIYIPFAKIIPMRDQLQLLYGHRLFIKPNNGDKAFTGFDCQIDDLELEISSLIQLEHVFPEQLCLVNNYQNLGATEWRCWVVGGKVVSSASYGWTDDIDAGTIPNEALNVATSAISDMYMIDDTFVVDIGMLDGKWKIIELNAMTTSGFYSGANVNDICSALVDIF